MSVRRFAVSSALLLVACARGGAPFTPEGDGADGGGSAADAATSDASDAALDDATADGASGSDGDAASPADGGASVDGGAGDDAGHDAGPAPLEVRRDQATGGTGGGAFDDTAQLPNPLAVASIAVRTGDRMDSISITYRNGITLQHGGGGGSEHALILDEGEVLTKARFCTGAHDGTVRIFYALITTSGGRTLEAGSSSTSCANFNAPDGFQIAGFHGRSGEEVDALGALYVPR